MHLTEIVISWHTGLGLNLAEIENYDVIYTVYKNTVVVLGMF